MVTSGEPELSREEEAQREMARTAMGGATARFLLLAFLALIAAPGLIMLWRMDASCEATPPRAGSS